MAAEPADRSAAVRSAETSAVRIRMEPSLCVAGSTSAWGDCSLASAEHDEHGPETDADDARGHGARPQQGDAVVRVGPDTGDHVGVLALHASV